MEESATKTCKICFKQIKEEQNQLQEVNLKTSLKDQDSFICNSCSIQNTLDLLQESLSSFDNLKAIKEEPGVEIIKEEFGVGLVENEVFDPKKTRILIPVFLCRQCGKFVDSKSKLAQHVNKEHKSRFQCGFCDFSTMEKACMEKHVCIKNKKSTLETHKLSHTGKKVDECLDRNTTTQKHHDIKEFRCHTCNFATCSDSDLKVHVLSHKDPKSSSTHTQQHQSSKTQTENIKTSSSKKKTDHCYFCKTPVSNFSRHLERKHNKETEVQEILKLPLRHARRKRLFSLLRKRGNYLISDVSTKPVRYTSNRLSALVTCQYCLGFYSSKFLWRHRKHCRKDFFAEKEHPFYKSHANLLENLLPCVRKEKLKNKKESSNAKRILTPWTIEQKEVVQEYFKEHIKNKTLPIKEECLVLKEKYQELLENKNWLKIKVFVQNVYSHKCSKSLPHCSKSIYCIRKAKYANAKTPAKLSVKRILTPWTIEQKQIVQEHFKEHIQTKTPPKKRECLFLKEKYERLLQNKDWLKIKVFVQNVYTNKCCKNVTQHSKSIYSSKKGKYTGAKLGVKRILTPWTIEQKHVVREYFKEHINNKTPPKEKECLLLKEKHEKLLENKDWLKIKVFIQNIYTKKI